MNIKDQQDIVDVMVATTDLWRAHEMEAWGRYFTEDADFVAHSGLWWTSLADNVEGHRDVPASVVARKHHYSQRVESVAEVVPGVALVHTRWDWPDPDGSVGHRAGVITYILVQRDGRWLIRAAHNSRSR